jgi:hypothetical protein
MMQDGKALQAGTSHYLGTGFAEAAGIRYQSKEGAQELAHTTSWGVSTRMIGGVIMTHGDDDGLRVPPAIAPHQIIILPMLREDDGDEALLAYCEEIRRELAKLSALGEPIRVLLDKRAGKATQKRWAWVKKGAPIILEIGGRDAAGGMVSAVRRDRLWKDDGKVNFVGQTRDDFIAAAVAELESIQSSLHAEATQRRDANITTGITSLDALASFFAEDQRYPGWVELNWSRPTGAALEKVVEQLKALKLTIRNTALDAAPAEGLCPSPASRLSSVFTWRAHTKTKSPAWRGRSPCRAFQAADCSRGSACRKGGKAFRHACAIRRLTGEQGKGIRCLSHGHALTRQRAATQSTGRRQQRCFQREVDDLGNPMVRLQGGHIDGRAGKLGHADGRGIENAIDFACRLRASSTMEMRPAP